MSQTQLKAGDKLIYPNQGLCIVTEVKSVEIAGQRHMTVVLINESSGARVMVPLEKLEKNGVRRVSSADDVKQVIAYLKSDSDKASLEWKKRAADNNERITRGGMVGLAEVVNELQVLSELRQLPPKERALYNTARRLLVDELAAATGLQKSDAEDAVDIVLFPPGKDRPKRSVEEFQALGEDDGLGLDADALGLDDDVPDDEPADDEDAEVDEPVSKKAKGSTAKPKKATAPPPPPKKRGRPPKTKTAAVPRSPKKRGRPAKPKTAPPPAPKKRGRPLKKK